LQQKTTFAPSLIIKRFMSHETPHSSDNRPTTSFKSSFWFVLILVGLFIAAVNFVNVMGHEDEGHGQQTHGATQSLHPTNEATSSQTLQGETGTGIHAADTTQHHGSNAATDTTHMEGH
jgi:hypothetical protein